VRRASAKVRETSAQDLAYRPALGPTGSELRAAIALREEPGLLYRPAMRRVLLDSNALDPMLNVPSAYETLEQAVNSGRLEVFYTHVTVDEIASTPDLEKRQWLLNLLVFLGRPVYTSVTVADVSRLNFCRLSDDDDIFEPLRSGSIGHSRDAVIAHTALTEQCALITNEKRLAARARDQGAEVLTTADLLAEFGFELNNQKG